MKQQTLQNIFNRVNTNPQFELIADEEKLNVDRVVGMEERTFFAYRIGTVAGVFQVRSFDFKSATDMTIDSALLNAMYRRSGKKMVRRIPAFGNKDGIEPNYHTDIKGTCQPQS